MLLFFVLPHGGRDQESNSLHIAVQTVISDIQWQFRTFSIFFSVVFGLTYSVIDLWDAFFFHIWRKLCCVQVFEFMFFPQGCSLYIYVASPRCFHHGDDHFCFFVFSVFFVHSLHYHMRSFMCNVMICT